MSHDHHHDHNHKPPRHWAKQHAWKFALVALMALAAMLAYIMSMDESVIPGSAPKVPPVASAPAK